MVVGQNVDHNISKLGSNSLTEHEASLKLKHTPKATQTNQSSRTCGGNPESAQIAPLR